MTVRKSVHLLVITLCLWLPLQAIAGQWLHCAQMQSTLGIDKQPAPIISQHETAPCHQVANTIIKSTTGQDQQPASDSDIKTCKHCQFVCHWHCVLLVDDLLSSQIDLTAYDIPFKNPSPAQPVLPQLQKPPRTAMV